MNPGDLVWSPELDLRGAVLEVRRDQVRVWWEDHHWSWENQDELEPWEIG